MLLEGKLFVWRDLQKGIADLYQHSVDRCPYCSSPLQKSWERNQEPRPVDWTYWGITYCNLCDWAYCSRIVPEHFEYIEYHSKIMCSFNINDADVVIAELGSHLKSNFSDVYALSPLRFEQVVCDVFRSNGYDALLTKQSCDGGVDVFVMDKQGKRAIVECKRYAKHRKVGIGVVQRLIGACVTWDTKKASLITTSSFSNPADEEAERARKHGYELDLVDASAFLSFLHVYNEKLPPLHKISEDVRRAIMLDQNPEPFVSLEETFKKYML